MKMRLCPILLLLALTGCDNLVGPWRRPPARVDDPRLTIPEQEKLGRQYLGLPDEAPLAGPSSGVARPGTNVVR